MDSNELLKAKTVVGNNLPLCISLLALGIALRNYRRKSGALVRGSFSIGGSIYCSDPYIAKYFLENLKDRTITIFAVYLQVSWNYYIEVEVFDEKPLILRPFESYNRHLGAIEFYASNERRVGMAKMLGEQSTRKRLVLSSSEGKYVVSNKTRRWYPVSEFFANHSTRVLQTVRSTYKGVDLGSNVRYVIEILPDQGPEEIIPIHPEDWRFRIFTSFRLTAQALEGKSQLEAFLANQIASGTLVCKKVEVHDLSEWRAEKHKFYKGDLAIAQRLNLFEYKILGRLGTLYSTWKAHRDIKKSFSTAAHIDSNDG